MDTRAVREAAFAMPLTSPSYPPGPYRYVDRAYLSIAYRSDPVALRHVVPEPLAPRDGTVRLQFIHMPDSTGFGSYSGVQQVVPVTVPDGSDAGYVVGMYVNVHPPIAAGRELWGFPQKLARPSLATLQDTLVGTLEFGPLLVARGTMGFKHRALAPDEAVAPLHEPGVLLKIIPHVDGRPRICELVRYRMTDIALKGAWSGPAALSLHPHALAPLADLPVLEVLSAVHAIADMTLELGTVIHDYLADAP